MIRRTRFLSLHAPDFPLVGALLALLAFGVLMVYDSSVTTSVDLFGGQYRYLILQLAWVLIGLGAALFFFLFDYRQLRGFSFPLLLVAILLLALVLLPTPFSEVISGARRWFSLPFDLPLLGKINFQPSEFSKLALVLYLAAIFSGKSAVLASARLQSKDFFTKSKAGFLAFLVPAVLTLGLILAEPDFGTGLVVAALSLAVFFLAGGSLLKILLLAPVAVAGGFALAITAPYRLQRLFTFLNPSLDPLGAGYQINQALIALGSGGLFGLGIGESRQKYGYIPGVSTDAVFAVVGEEFGFVGTVLVLSLLAFIVYRGFEIARKAPDDFGRVLAGGITSWFGIQALVNLAAITGLFPLTGIPLPLISYGGSSLVVLLAAFGILLNISRRTTRT